MRRFSRAPSATAVPMARAVASATGSGMARTIAAPARYVRTTLDARTRELQRPARRPGNDAYPLRRPSGYRALSAEGRGENEMFGQPTFTFTCPRGSWVLSVR